MAEDENVTWDDVAIEMAKSTGRKTDDPVVVGAIEALRRTKLRPSFVLCEWLRAAHLSGSREPFPLRAPDDVPPEVRKMVENAKHGESTWRQDSAEPSGSTA